MYCIPIPLADPGGSNFFILMHLVGGGGIAQNDSSAPPPLRLAPLLGNPGFAAACNPNKALCSSAKE